MPAANPFRLEGEWLKAQFHAHSLDSDGELPPDAVARQYHYQGFDVLTISDHWTMTKVDGPDGLLLIPGAELMVDPVGGPMCPEFLAIGIDDVPEEPSGDPANWYPYEHCVIKTFATFDDGAAFVESFGGASVLCHPSWSGLPQAAVFAAAAMHGIELWNASAHRENDRGDSAYVWDLALDAGLSFAPFGTDDSHYPAFDVGDAWTMVRARGSDPRRGGRCRCAPATCTPRTAPRSSMWSGTATRWRSRARPPAMSGCTAAGRRGSGCRSAPRAARGRRDPRTQRSRADHARAVHAGRRRLDGHARAPLVAARRGRRAGRRAWSNVI